MEYMILAIETEGDFARRDDPETAGEYWSAWSGYLAVLAESGVMTDARGLRPASTSTTLRRRGDELVVEDGPYADSKEQLGGFFLIDVPDLDTALTWARRCPSADTGSVEVRPVLPPRTA